MRKVKVSGKVVGEGESCFIVAEAGINHNGDVILAKRLIDAAKKAGADAVKFQTFKAKNILTEDAVKANYQKESRKDQESQYEMVRRLELNREDFKELADYAKKKDIIFLSSPFDIESVDLLCEIDVPAFKIPSGEITNLPFLRYIAKKKKPIILSTGMSKLGEVEDAIDVIRDEGVEDIVLLHCVTGYPVEPQDVNLRTLQTLRCAFGLPVGFSDHTLSLTIPAVAFALGACVIEKHLTLDKNLPGPDHKASLEPDEFKKMVNSVREVEKALGDGIKRPTEKEEEIKKVVRKSIVAKEFIPEGVSLTENMLTFKRPGTGISPLFVNIILGRKTKKSLKKDEILTWEIIE